MWTAAAVLLPANARSVGEKQQSRESNDTLMC